MNREKPTFKLIQTKDAAGHILCHDLTQIIPGVTKDARFRKGHVVTEEDIPILLSMGKDNLYIWKKLEGYLHEDEAVLRLITLCKGPHMRETAVKEGKVELIAERDGLFTVDVARLNAVNGLGEMIIATRHSGTPVRAGDVLLGARVIPLVIPEVALERAEKLAGELPLVSLAAYKLKTAAILTIGNEVFHGRIEDAFTPVVVGKLQQYGVELKAHKLIDDNREKISAAILELRQSGAHLILCTGGMSVDPDDKTPAAISDLCPHIVTYGAPVLPGSMFLLGYFEDGVPILGLPGCVMYQKPTIFDLVLPQVLAGKTLSREDFARMGHGGLCLKCEVCRYPICPFGK